MTTIDRFDYSQGTRDAMNAAVTIGIIDAVLLGCMMSDHGTDAVALMHDLTEVAFAQRHDTDRKNAEWCKVNAAWWKVRLDAKRAAAEGGRPAGC